MENCLQLLKQLSAPGTSPLFPLDQLSIREWLTETATLTAESSIRILIVLSQQPGETGSGVYLREVVSELQRLGHKPYLLAAHYRPLSHIDFPSLSDDQIYTMIFDNGENSHIAEIGFPIPGMSLDMPYLHLPFRQLAEHQLEEYCHTWILKLQAIVQEVRPHIIHINHLWFLPGIARIATPWLPIVATSHGSEYKLLQNRPVFGPLVMPGVQLLDAIMPVSRDNADWAVTFFGVHPDRIQIIGNGYNPHLFQILPRVDGEAALHRLLAPFPDLPSWNKLVLYVGKFADYKGVPYLIRAAKLYGEFFDDTVLTLIVGDGSKQVRFNLENLVKAVGLEKIVLLPGKLPYHQVGSMMNLADVFVLPSIDEPFGLVLLEALACGVRSVAADRGGPPFFVPEVLREKGLVTLVKPLGLFPAQQPDPADEERYATDLATAIVNQISQQTTEAERRSIADSVKDQTWSARSSEIIQVYLASIRLRRQAISQ